MGKVKQLYEDLCLYAYDRGYSDGLNGREYSDMFAVIEDERTAYEDGYHDGVYNQRGVVYD